MGIKSWWSSLWGAKSYSVQVVVGDDGFIVAPSFSGGDLYTVYTQALWTYICAKRIAMDIASFPARAEVMGRGGAWEPAPATHPLNVMLRRPYGPGADKPPWNWQQQIAAGVLRMELGGNQFYRETVGGGRLLSLGLILGELKANTDANGVPISYELVGSAAGKVYADQIVNIMHPSPCSWWEGVAPVVAAEQAIRVDYAAARRNRYDLETRIAPGVVFKVKALFSMSDTQRTAAKAMLAEGYEGAVNAGKSMVIGDNTTIEGAPLHSAGDIPTMADNARDRIISAHDVSPPTVGVLRDVKYQTWEQALRAQFTFCIGPRLEMIYGPINSQAVQPVYGDGVRIGLDYTKSALGMAAIRERAETAKQFLDLGYPANAVNARFDLGMPYYEELELPNVGAVVAGHAEDVNQPDDDEPDDEPDEEPVVDDDGDEDE